MSAIPASVRVTIERVVGAAGFDLESVDVLDKGGRRELRVVVDRDGGAGLDVLAELTRELGDPLDETLADTEDAALGAQPYDLEVTTPGIDRPLTAPRHWRRARGRSVAVTTVDDAEVRGRIGESNDDAVTIVQADKGRMREISVEFTSVRQAIVQVDFTRPGEAELRRCGLSDEEIALRRRTAD